MKTNKKDLEDYIKFLSDKDGGAIIQYRKENYYRGFRACLILVVAPIILGLVILANIFISNNI